MERTNEYMGFDIWDLTHTLTRFLLVILQLEQLIGKRKGASKRITNFTVERGKIKEEEKMIRAAAALGQKDIEDEDAAENQQESLRELERRKRLVDAQEQAKKGLRDLHHVSVTTVINRRNVAYNTKRAKKVAAAKRRREKARPHL